tara:strand:+ start:8325 stop:8750 length:426 start_codon:yes stop_codon:yes gene_type:complete
MKNDFDAINDSLEIEATPTEIVPTPETSIRKSPKKGEGDDTDYDYDYTRGQLYSLIEKGQEAIDGIIDIAQQSDSPRAYEVAGQLIKNVADTTDKLLDLQSKLKKLKEEESGPKNVTTNNTMFIGSTAELQKLLKKGLPNE